MTDIVGNLQKSAEKYQYTKGKYTFNKEKSIEDSKPPQRFTIPEGTKVSFYIHKVKDNRNAQGEGNIQVTVVTNPENEYGKILITHFFNFPKGERFFNRLLLALRPALEDDETFNVETSLRGKCAYGRIVYATDKDGKLLKDNYGNPNMRFGDLTNDSVINFPEFIDCKDDILKPVYFNSKLEQSSTPF